MKTPMILAALVAAAASVAAPARAALDAEGTARLDALQRAPASAGELVYRGSVVAQKGDGRMPLYTYERRVVKGTDGARAAHITTNARNETILSEEASFDTRYTLRRFDAVNRQTGVRGSVELSGDGRRLDYTVWKDGKQRTASEKVNAPVVSGPSLHGFILANRDRLVPGRALPVRMIVLGEATTYGFDIRRLPDAAGRQAFSITPSSWLVRLAIAPLTVTFDAEGTSVLRYEGRVPPMREQGGGKLEALDARVDYTMAVDRYF